MNDITFLRLRFFYNNLIKLLLPTLLIITLFGVFIYSILNTYIADKEVENNYKLLENSARTIELFFQEQQSLNLTVVASAMQFEELKKILNSPYPSQEQLVTLAHLKTFIDSPTIGKEYLDSIYVYVENEYDRFLTSTHGGFVEKNYYLDTEWLSLLSTLKISEGISTSSRTIPKEYLNGSSYKKDVISLFQKIKISEDNYSIIVVNIDADYISHYLQELSTFKGQYLLILDNDLNIIASNRPLDGQIQRNLLSNIQGESEQNALILMDEKLYISNILIQGINSWTFLALTPEEELFESIHNFRIGLLLMVLFAVAFAVLYSYYQTKEVTRHLTHIMNLLNRAKRQKVLTVQQSSKGTGAIYTYISDQVIKNFLEREYLESKISSMKYKSQAAEFSILQAQLNPHFLYNTLESINWRAVQLTGKFNVVNKMIELLSEVLRYSLEEPGNTVPFELEKKYTDNYIALQKIRYRDTFDLEWVIDEEIYESRILKLMFQPILENSIFHGFQSGQRPGKIRIKATCQSHFTMIKVIDNGVGMTARELTKLKERLVVDDLQSKQIGITNTHRRLKVVYGDNYQIKIRSKKNVGTVITIIFQSGKF